MKSHFLNDIKRNFRRLSLATVISIIALINLFCIDKTDKIEPFSNPLVLSLFMFFIFLHIFSLIYVLCLRFNKKVSRASLYVLMLLPVVWTAIVTYAQYNIVSSFGIFGVYIDNMFFSYFVIVGLLIMIFSVKYKSGPIVYSVAKK